MLLTSQHAALVAMRRQISDPNYSANDSGDYDAHDCGNDQICDVPSEEHERCSEKPRPRNGNQRSP